MGRNTNKIKERAEELLEEYQGFRDDAFFKQFQDKFMKRVEVKNGTDWVMKHYLTEDMLHDFIGSFDFPEPDEWAFSQAEAELANHEEDIADYKRDMDRGL